MKNIVDIDWLKAKLTSKNLVIVDCRFSLSNPAEGKEAYKVSHIPGAVYCDLEEVLSSPVQSHGGRHPLPNMQSFKQFIEASGISNNTCVVSYDNGEGAFAARFWWLMKYIGHKDIFVLNGGLKEWKKANNPLNSDIPAYTRGDYEIELQPTMLATYEEVKDIVENKPDKTILIDSREPKRYLGLEEPIDKKPGRIPGAINQFWMEGFKDGLYKNVDAQKERFKDLDKDAEHIVYCGSGVTAVPNYLILHELGFNNLKLYIGSYSDWISHHENEIETQ